MGKIKKRGMLGQVRLGQRGMNNDRENVDRAKNLQFYFRLIFACKTDMHECMYPPFEDYLFALYIFKHFLYNATHYKVGIWYVITYGVSFSDRFYVLLPLEVVVLLSFFCGKKIILPFFSFFQLLHLIISKPVRPQKSIIQVRQVPICQNIAI